jgi:hypothetical protein
MHQVTGSAILAGSNNEILDSNYCTVINGSTNYISGRNNTHVIGDDIVATGVNDDDKFYVGCYNGLECSGPISGAGNLIIDGNATIVGDLNVVGDITAFYSSSDERLKDNISVITGCLDKVLSLDAIEFDWNTNLQSTYSGHDIGLIAQQVQKVTPETVVERDNGYLAMKYEKIIPLLIGATQEQDIKICELEKQIQELIDRSNH